MAKSPLGSAGSIIGWVILAGIVVAIMTLYSWDPFNFITTTLDRISNWFLQWEWFRKIVGSGS